MRFWKHHFSALALFLMPCMTFAQTTEQKLIASDGGEEDYFGTSVSVYEDVAIVGAREYDSVIDGPDGDGKAYVFGWDGTTWNEEQILTASDGDEGDGFGGSVLVVGGVAFIGAFLAGETEGENGAVYVFRRDESTWNEVQKLVASDGQRYDAFGSNVTISGDFLFITASGWDDFPVEVGSVYVFRWNGSTWNEEQLLTASGSEGGVSFGTSVSAHQDIALIGDATDAGFRGSAYVFRRNGSTWNQEHRITASDGSEYDIFGQAVAVHGDIAFIGAPWDDDNCESSGSVYVFRWDGSTWSEEQKLTASDGGENDNFGRAVAVRGDTALVGAPAHESNGMRFSGSVYVFRWDGSTWYEEQKLTASDGDEFDSFGGDIDFDGDIAFVGAIGDDDNGDASGSVYVYSNLLTVPLEPGLHDPPSALLSAPQPNPAHGQSTIHFTVQEAIATTLTLHDLLGRQVATLYSGTPVPNQSHSVTIDGSSLPSGVYFAQLKVGGVLGSTQKVILLR